jgi:hypothetical protein
MNQFFCNVVWLVAAAALAAPACAKNGPVPEAPNPRRPKEIRAKSDGKVRTDCEPTDPRSLPPSLGYKERSITEAKNLAEQGFSLLQRAEERETPRIEREAMITEAVELFITSLVADPYNVHATYNLAASYARIDRVQCAINLLDRLVELRKLPSQQREVEAKLDRLLGRGKYRRKMDPDFRELRDLDSFREVIKKFCPGIDVNGALDRC